MQILSRYNSKCRKCGGSIARGEAIEWTKRAGARHLECVTRRAPVDPEVAEARRQRRRDDFEYAQGVADVERWHENRRMFGDDLADQMEIERELREGWDY